MATQRILKRVENGKVGLEASFELVDREFANPRGALVIDEKALEEKLDNALDYIYFSELAGAKMRANDALNKTVIRFENGKATEAEVVKARIKSEEAGVKYGAYPNIEKKFDRFAFLVACVMTGTRLVDLSKASYMIAMLRSPEDFADDSKVKSAVKEYVDNLLQLQSRDIEYVKPYTCSLNLEKVRNLRKIATMTLKKWTKKGIADRGFNDLQVWGQVMLTVMAEGYSLEIDKTARKDDDLILGWF